MKKKTQFWIRTGAECGTLPAAIKKPFALGKLCFTQTS